MNCVVLQVYVPQNNPVTQDIDRPLIDCKSSKITSMHNLTVACLLMTRRVSCWKTTTVAASSYYIAPGGTERCLLTGYNNDILQGQLLNKVMNLHISLQVNYFITGKYIIFVS